MKNTILPLQNLLLTACFSLFGPKPSLLRQNLTTGPSSLPHCPKLAAIVPTLALRENCIAYLL